MAWPTPSDYQDAIQNPQTCFLDPRLRAAQPALGPLGLPKVASGNYCSVYELRAGNQRWAVRCFNRQVPDMKRRYKTIDEHLNRHPHLPWIVGFDYLDEGIRIRGQWYPVVVMDWVEGSTLSRYLEKRVRDSAAVLNLAEQWPRVISDLRASQIAHGDLQHGNVMIAHEAVRLVDYDNLFVPAFRGERSPELGRLHYQHPRRSPDDFDENIGNFAALVIYLSLRALAADPSLWRYYNGENLVLTAEDYQRPGASAALAQMRASADPLVPRLTAELARCCALSVPQVPPLEAVLTSAGTGAPAWSAPRTVAPPPSAGLPDWLNAGPPDPASPPAGQPPGSGRRSRRTAAAPPAPPGSGWWEEAAPPAPAGPRSAPHPRRPTGMPSTRSRRAPAGRYDPGAGTVALPGRPRTAAPRAGGCVASLARSCMIMAVLAWILAIGAIVGAYVYWPEIVRIINQAPFTVPQSPVPERWPPRDLPEAPPATPPGTVPTTPQPRPEADRAPDADRPAQGESGSQPPKATEPPGPPGPRPPVQSPRPNTRRAPPRTPESDAAKKSATKKFSS